MGPKVNRKQEKLPNSNNLIVGQADIGMLLKSYSQSISFHSPGQPMIITKPCFNCKCILVSETHNHLKLLLVFLCF